MSPDIGENGYDPGMPPEVKKSYEVGIGKFMQDQVQSQNLLKNKNLLIIVAAVAAWYFFLRK